MKIYKTTPNEYGWFYRLTIRETDGVCEIKLKSNKKEVKTSHSVWFEKKECLEILKFFSKELNELEKRNEAKG